MADTTVVCVTPDAFTRRVFNPLVRRLTLMGLSVWGSSELRVKGRRSGEWRANVVNPLRFAGAEYLVAPLGTPRRHAASRGVTQWVRNLRTAGRGDLRVGRRVDSFTAHELPDAEKIAILRAYLTKRKFEVGKFFGGVGPDATGWISPPAPATISRWTTPLPRRRSATRSTATSPSSPSTGPTG